MDGEYLEMLKENEQEVKVHYKIERSRYYPAVMYLSNGDPGYPAEGGEIEAMDVTNDDGDVLDPESIFVEVSRFYPTKHETFITLSDYLDEYTQGDESDDD